MTDWMYVDVKALLRIAQVFDIPIANNIATADFMIHSSLMNEQYSHQIENFKNAVAVALNCSPSSRQLKKYKFFLPAEIYLLAVFMQLASKFHVFPLVLKFQDSFANVCCCSNLYNLRSFLREYFYQ